MVFKLIIILNIILNYINYLGNIIIFNDLLINKNNIYLKKVVYTNYQKYFIFKDEVKSSLNLNLEKDSKIIYSYYYNQKLLIFCMKETIKKNKKNYKYFLYFNELNFIKMFDFSLKFELKNIIEIHYDKINFSPTIYFLKDNFLNKINYKNNNYKELNTKININDEQFKILIDLRKYLNIEFLLKDLEIFKKNIIFEKNHIQINKFDFNDYSINKISHDYFYLKIEIINGLKMYSYFFQKINFIRETNIFMLDKENIGTFIKEKLLSFSLYHILTKFKAYKEIDNNQIYKKLFKINFSKLKKSEIKNYEKYVLKIKDNKFYKDNYDIYKCFTNINSINYNLNYIIKNNNFECIFHKKNKKTFENYKSKVNFYFNEKISKFDYFKNYFLIRNNKYWYLLYQNQISIHWVKKFKNIIYLIGFNDYLFLFKKKGIEIIKLEYINYKIKIKFIRNLIKIDDLNNLFISKYNIMFLKDNNNNNIIFINFNSDKNRILNFTIYKLSIDIYNVSYYTTTRKNYQNKIEFDSNITHFDYSNEFLIVYLENKVSIFYFEKIKLEFKKLKDININEYVNFKLKIIKKFDKKQILFNYKNKKNEVNYLEIYNLNMSYEIKKLTTLTFPNKIKIIKFILYLLTRKFMIEYVIINYIKYKFEIFNFEDNFIKKEYEIKKFLNNKKDLQKNQLIFLKNSTIVNEINVNKIFLNYSISNFYFEIHSNWKLKNYFSINKNKLLLNFNNDNLIYDKNLKTINDIKKYDSNFFINLKDMEKNNKINEKFNKNSKFTFLHNKLILYENNEIKYFFTNLKLFKIFKFKPLFEFNFNIKNDIYYICYKNYFYKDLLIHLCKKFNKQLKIIYFLIINKLKENNVENKIIDINEEEENQYFKEEINKNNNKKLMNNEQVNIIKNINNFKELRDLKKIKFFFKEILINVDIIKNKLILYFNNGTFILKFKDKKLDKNNDNLWCKIGNDKELILDIFKVSKENYIVLLFIDSSIHIIINIFYFYNLKLPLLKYIKIWKFYKDNIFLLIKNKTLNEINILQYDIKINKLYKTYKLYYNTNKIDKIKFNNEYVILFSYFNKKSYLYFYNILELKNENLYYCNLEIYDKEIIDFKIKKLEKNILKIYIIFENEVNILLFENKIFLKLKNNKKFNNNLFLIGVNNLNNNVIIKPFSLNKNNINKYEYKLIDEILIILYFVLLILLVFIFYYNFYKFEKNSLIWKKNIKKMKKLKKLFKSFKLKKKLCWEKIIEY